MFPFAWFYIRFHNNLLNLLLSRHSPCHLLGHCLTRQAPAKFKIEGSHHVTKCDKPSTCLALHILHTVYCMFKLYLSLYVSWSVKPRGTGRGKIPRSYYSKNEWLLFNLCPTRQKHPKTIHSYLVQSCSMHTWRNFQEHGPMDPCIKDLLHDADLLFLALLLHREDEGFS